MALAPKALATHGLVKATLDSRGARLETEGLVGGAPTVALITRRSFLPIKIANYAKYYARRRR